MDAIVVRFLSCAASADRLRSVLTRDELDRERAFSRTEDKRLFVLGRAACRLLLAQHLQREPSELVISISEAGKPYLPGHPIHFNISHSGNVVAVALAADPVGIDVERVTADRDLARIAPAVFVEEERARIASAADPAACFFALWTAKEAVLKATGSGFLRSPFDVVLPPIGDTFELVDDRGPTSRERCVVARLSVQGGYTGAVAVAGRPCALQTGWMDADALAASCGL